ncbi:MAG: transporter, family, multidrug resistance protein [Bradyrhizobium sp.]|jgi:DHA1 family bicyclomycin/chloramphenicol resistance-like MFS transporter|nr:transporter, family, multidrug resistance protein [Bradyrhizobium sp.]
MRFQPTSFAFTLLLGLLASVPSFGIDMSLPALAAMGAALGARPSEAGFSMSLFMLSLAAAPLIYGPASDRYGRKPVILFGVMLFVIGSTGCALAQSLSPLLIWRFIQGAGAAITTMSMAIIRDLFDGQVARAKIANVVIAIHVVPMVAPAAGAALLGLGGWRLIYAAQGAVGLVLLCVIWVGFTESARIDPDNRLMPSVIVRSYIRVLTHPISLGYILVAAAAVGAILAYATGSALFLIDVVGLTPSQYGLIFGASAVAVMSGAFFDGRLSTWGMSPRHALMIGLALLALAAMLLLAMTLTGWMPLPLVISLLIAATFAFGMSMPNAMNAAMQPLPQIAGAVGAAAGSSQMTAGAISSALVAVLYDGRSALSMTIVMALCSLLAVVSYLLLARPAERVVVPS